MSRRRLPAIPAVPESALRDYGTSDSVPAVWRRLKVELSGRAPSARRSPLAYAWAPALAAVIFGSGVFVGARFIRPQALPFVRAEPPTQAARPAGAAPAQSAAEPEALLPQVKALRGHGRRVASAAATPEPLGFTASENAPYGASVPAPVPEWQRLVEVGDFASARRSLDQQGGFDVAMAHASPSELMSLVDVARASGERGQATRALRQVLSHPEAPEAPLAAWTLGNLLDQAGDQPGAAQAFALYRRLSPAGDFAEDAAARQVDVALAEGNAELVTQLVEDYARDFPHGRRLGEFRRAASALAARGADAGPKVEGAHDDSEDDNDEAQAVVPNASPSPASAPSGEAH
jgi:hypothetical protein